MRLFYGSALLTLVILLFITVGESSSFTVHRPRSPVTRRTSPSPGEIAPTPSVPVPTATETPVNNYGTGGTGSTGDNTPTAAPTTAAPSPSPSPSPPVTSKKTFPFVIAFVGLAIAGVIIWYFTRNINFKRLFK